MNKVLVVYNTCGISGKDNTQAYLRSLYSIIQQEFEGFRLCLSACCNSTLCINTIKNTFGNRISYNVVEDVVPISVSFNLAVQNCVKEFGDFEQYLYIDSGCVLPEQDLISTLYKTHQDNNCGICAAWPDQDSGIKQWFNLGEFLGDERESDKLFNGDNLFKVPLGKTTNLHCQTFDHSFLEQFGQILPDIFAGHCMESVFPYLCASLYKDFYIISKKIQHVPNLDGGSSGFRPENWESSTGRPRWDHPFVVDSVVDRLKRFGYWGGYEECFDIIKYDPARFENGYTKDPGLANILKQNAFLQPNEFDYSKVQYKFTK